MKSFLLLASVSVGGVLLARRLAPSLNRATDILALGTSLGLALFSMVGFVIGWALGLSPATVALSAGVVVAAGFLLGATEGLSGALRSLLQIPRGPLMLALFAIVLTFQISDRVLIETPEGGIATGNRHNYGDLPFHMGVAAGFAYGDNFPPMHPELAGVALTYPFLSDVLSAMLVRSADSWRQAFFWPTFVLGLCVLPALTRFGEAVTGSRRVTWAFDSNSMRTLPSSSRTCSQKLLPAGNILMIWPSPVRGPSGVMTRKRTWSSIRCCDMFSPCLDCAKPFWRATDTEVAGIAGESFRCFRQSTLVGRAGHDSRQIRGVSPA